MWETNFINQYNYWIGRYNKACAFFSNPKTEVEQVEEWQEEFNSVVRKLSELNEEYYNNTGQMMDEKEMFEGFKV